MSEESLAATALALFIGACGVVWLKYRWEAYVVDDTRDRMFEVRDDLFRFSHDHALLEVPAHRLLREMINALIRYAHRMTFARLLGLLLGQTVFGTSRAYPPSYIRWLASVEQLPEPQASRFREAHATCVVLMVRHIVYRSVVLCALLTLYGWASSLGRIASLKAVARLKPVGYMEADALLEMDSGVRPSLT